MDQDGAYLADGGHVDGSPTSAQPGTAKPGRLPRPPRAVVFDLDGTLIDTEQVYRTAFYTALADLGWTLPDAGYNGLVGLSSTARRGLLPGLLGPDFPVSRFFDSYRRHRTAALGDAIPLKSGVVALLDLLDGAGLPYAIATSASARTASDNLYAAGLLHRFPIVVTRDDVERGKPHPDSFLEASRLLGHAPEDCLAVEDSAAGVAAAYRAGLMVVTIPDALPPTPEMLTRCVASLGSLLELSELLARELARKNNRSPLRV